MDEAPIKPTERKNAATKRMRVRFTMITSFIFGERRHVRKTHGDIKAATEFEEINRENCLAFE